MKSPGCLAIAILLALFIGGGQSVWTGLRNRSITEISIGEFERAKPDASWLRVTDGDMRTLDAAYFHGRFDKEAKEVVVPYLPAGKSAETDPIHLLVKTKRPALLRLIEDSREMEEKLSPDASEAEKFSAGLELLGKHGDALDFGKSVEGLVQSGIDGTSKETEKLRKLFPTLAPDFVVLEEGRKPSIGGGVVLLLCGLALAAFIFRPRKSSATPPPLPPPLPPSGRG